MEYSVLTNSPLLVRYIWIVSSSPVSRRRTAAVQGWDLRALRSLRLGDFRRASEGGRGRARTDGDHHVVGGVKVQGVDGTLVVAEEATGHHRPDALMVQDNHRERLCFAPDFMRPPGLDSSSPVSSSPGDAKRKKIGPFWFQSAREPGRAPPTRCEETRRRRDNRVILQG